MDPRFYRAALFGLLVIVLVTIYVQFTTFGTGQYWVTVIVLLLAWVASKLLMRKQKA